MLLFYLLSSFALFFRCSHALFCIPTPGFMLGAQASIFVPDLEKLRYILWCILISFKDVKSLPLLASKSYSIGFVHEER